MRRIACVRSRCVGCVTAGCSSATSDLQRFIEETKKEPGGRVEPLPEVKPYETFIYSATRPALAVPCRRARVSANGAGVRPESERNREFLEQFSLDTLKMVGTLSSAADCYGLVQTKDGLVHRVSRGNHMGQNDGKITDITPVEDQPGRDRSGRPRRLHGAARGAWP